MSLDEIQITKLENNYLDWSLDSIGVTNAWKKTKGKGVKISVMDSGLDKDRDDFFDTFKFGMNMIEKSFMIDDYYGHGTHVAGLIAGKYTGVAPESELYITKVLNDEGKGGAGSVLDGITFSIEREVDILCISLGVSRVLPVMMQERIAQAYNSGITIICATGNNGANQPQFPAQMEETIAVGGYNKNLNRALFSDDGHDVLAPAVDVLSTYKNGQYARMTGTSMASPIVAGGIALLISFYKEKGIKLTPKQIKGMISNLRGKKFNIDDLLKMTLQVQ